eukprot:7332551-Prymnesium_polylepis.1
MCIRDRCSAAAARGCPACRKSTAAARGPARAHARALILPGLKCLVCRAPRRHPSETQSPRRRVPPS